jgi:hypothetical protein
MYQSRGDADHSARVPDRIGGVYHEIHRDLLELCRVALDRREAGGEIQLERDVCWQG